MKIKKIRKALDTAWRFLVYAKNNEKCEVCGKKGVQAHHIFGRGASVRWEIWNGMALCPTHHTFGRKLSAHNSKGSLNWKEYLIEEYFQGDISKYNRYYQIANQSKVWKKEELLKHLLYLLDKLDKENHELFYKCIRTKGLIKIFKEVLTKK